MNKPQGRQKTKNAAHYSGQWMRTFRNKEKRVLRSNGKVFHQAWHTKFYQHCLAMAARKRSG
jgi:hypothetical protein